MKKFLFSFFAMTVFYGCYSFKGIDIAPEVKTFSIKRFDVRAVNSPPTLDQLFTDRLVDKVQRESRLNRVDASGDVQFSGTITEYSVSPVAPRPGEVAELSRLQISVSVEYLNQTDEKKNWTSTFSRYEDYGNTTDLNSIQESLIESINDQLVEDIFNKAFTNW